MDERNTPYHRQLERWEQLRRERTGRLTCYTQRQREEDFWQWVRDKCAEKGWTEDLEAEARQLVFAAATGVIHDEIFGT